MLWVVDGMKLQDGLVADKVLAVDNLPLADANFFLFDLPRPEAVVVCSGPSLPDGFAIFTDAILNINSYDHVDVVMRPVFFMMGFRRAVHLPEPTFTKWMTGRKGMSSKQHLLGEYKRLLALFPFDSYSSGHGPAVVGDAHRKISKKVTAKFG